MSVDVTIAIPTFESDPHVLRRVLRAAAEQSARPIIVVDMSRTAVVADACAELSRVEHVPFPQSRGVSDSRNECVRRSPTRHVLFLDSDAVPEPGWAQAMAAGFEHDRVAVVAARVLPEWEALPPRILRTATASDWLSMFDLGSQPRAVPRIMGTSYALDRERAGDSPFAAELGRSPESAVGHEEVRLALDVQRRGWRCWYAPGAVVRHHIPSSRVTWRAMLKRAFVAGQETRLECERLAPLPRRMAITDHAFRAAVAPAFLLGRAVGPPRAHA